MRRGALLALAATAALGAGCNHDTLPVIYPDGGPDFTSPGDLAQVCRTHQILSVPLDEIQLVEPQGGRIGSTLLVRVGFSLREGCDVPGDINVRVMPGNATDFVVITMRTWRGNRDCGAPQPGWRTVALGPDLGIGNTMVFLSDGAPGGTRMLSATLARSPNPSCMISRGLGSYCDGDCQCTAVEKHSRCMQFSGHFVCDIPCSEDADCQGLPAGINACVYTSSRCTGCLDGCGCHAEPGCGFGQACDAVDGACRPIGGLPPARCTCDTDCGVGRLCAQEGTCLIPCTTSASCPKDAPVCDGGRCR